MNEAVQMMDTLETEGKELCPHCSCLLAKKTIRAHKRLYFDMSSGKWLKKRHVHTDEIDDDEIGFEVDPQQPDENESCAIDAPPIVDFSSASAFASSLGDEDCFDENSDGEL
jgi:hypothetical protein